MKRLYLIARHFTLNSGSYAGFIEEFARFASKKGYNVKVLCARVDKNLPENENHQFCEVIRFNIPNIRIPLLGMNKDYFFLSKNVKKYLKSEKLNNKDLIISNTRASLGAVGSNYIIRMGQPAGAFLKNMELANSYVSLVTRAARKIHFKLQESLERNASTNAKGFIYSSIKSKKINDLAYGVSDKPYFIPHSGVKFDELQGGTRIKLPGRKLLFVSAGEERIRKGVVYLEKALPEIFNKYQDVNLLHVGDKSGWNVPEKYQHRILSVGRVPWSKMKDYYKSSDMVLNCALNEWIPNVIFEAMASGIPVVTSDIEGIDECISHKKDGFIYRRADVQGLIQGICFVLDNPLFRKKASIKLKEKAKKLDYPIFSEKLLNYTESILKGNKTPSINLLK